MRYSAFDPAVRVALARFHERSHLASEDSNQKQSGIFQLRCFILAKFDSDVNL